MIHDRRLRSGSQVLNFRQLIKRQLETKDDNVILSSGPGLGFEFDDTNVYRLSIDGSRAWGTVKSR
jgi:hypothetical protein